MIGFLKGKLTFKDDSYVYLEVGGVGYKVLAAKDVLGLSDNSIIQLFTYTHVREDAFELFGFLKFEDLKLFEKLISVSGIGPKTAINIFSVGSYTEILKAIDSNNLDFFLSVPRLGRKNAQKIIIELKGKLFKKNISLNIFEKNQNMELSSALKNMGFSGAEIQQALRQFDSDTDLSLEEKIKSVLKFLAK